jgi:hypothetical protein
MAYRAPVEDIVFTLKHAAGFAKARAAGLYDDLRVNRIERNLGLYASPICHVIYRDHSACISYLVGEENRGMACTSDIKLSCVVPSPIWHHKSYNRQLSAIFLHPDSSPSLRARKACRYSARPANILPLLGTRRVSKSPGSCLKSPAAYARPRSLI